MDFIALELRPRELRRFYSIRPACSRRQSLELAELLVQARRCDELGVRAELDDATGFEHDNRICAADGGEAVRDDNRRAPRGQTLQRAHDRGFGLCVEACGWVVRDQDPS